MTEILTFINTLSEKGFNLTHYYITASMTPQLFSTLCTTILWLVASYVTLVSVQAIIQAVAGVDVATRALIRIRDTQGIGSPGALSLRELEAVEVFILSAIRKSKFVDQQDAEIVRLKEQIARLKEQIAKLETQTVVLTSPSTSIFSNPSEDKRD